MEIRIENLKKNYGERTVLDIPSLRVTHGEMLGLVGNNGAGKTTLFSLVLDLLEADEGRVGLVPASGSMCADGSIINPAASEKWKSMAGAFMDDSFLIDFLSPEEYFDFIACAHGMTPIDWERVESSFLAPFLSFASGELFGQRKLLRDLSAGNRQKAGIIAALFTRPELVVLDEPFNFLDPSSQIRLKKLLVEFQQANGSTVLVSSHNLQHVEDICSRIVLLEKGTVRYDLGNDKGKASAVLDRYFSM